MSVQTKPVAAVLTRNAKGACLCLQTEAAPAKAEAPAKAPRAKPTVAFASAANMVTFAQQQARRQVKYEASEYRSGGRSRGLTFLWSIPSGYNWNATTRDNYRLLKTEDPDSTAVAEYGTQFYGEYAHIRRSLDISYHGNYIELRQLMQDRLIGNVVATGQAHPNPWIVFTAGAMGAGKSHTINWMSDRGFFPLPDIVQIDTDGFREQLPEWEQYKERHPLKAGNLTHLESGYMVEIATEAAMANRRNIWVDGSLRDSEWYSKVFARLRQQHPEYRIAIVYIYASRRVVFRRVDARAQVTGRHVPRDVLVESMAQVPASVERLTPLVHFVAHIQNHAEPQISKVVSAPPPAGLQPPTAPGAGAPPPLGAAAAPAPADEQPHFASIGSQSATHTSRASVSQLTRQASSVHIGFGFTASMRWRRTTNTIAATSSSSSSAPASVGWDGRGGGGGGSGSEGGSKSSSGSKSKRGTILKTLGKASGGSRSLSGLGTKPRWYKEYFRCEGNGSNKIEVWRSEADWRDAQKKQQDADGNGASSSCSRGSGSSSNSNSSSDSSRALKRTKNTASWHYGAFVRVQGCVEVGASVARRLVLTDSRGVEHRLKGYSKATRELVLHWCATGGGQAASDGRRYSTTRCGGILMQATMGAGAAVAAWRERKREGAEPLTAAAASPAGAQAAGATATGMPPLDDTDAVEDSSATSTWQDSVILPNGMRMMTGFVDEEEDEDEDDGNGNGDSKNFEGSGRHGGDEQKQDAAGASSAGAGADEDADADAGSGADAASAAARARRLKAKRSSLVAQRGQRHSLNIRPLMSRNNRLWEEVSHRFAETLDLHRATEHTHRIEREVLENKVVLWSKTWCHFCDRLKLLLDELGVQYKAVELDTLEFGVGLQWELGKRTHIRTVPQLFVGGECFGDCTTVIEMHDDNELVPAMQERGVIFSSTGQQPAAIAE